ncbi:MAG: CvpA family protein [Dorea sp.]
MDWVLLTIGAIFLISIIVGICRGAVKITVSLVTTIVTLVVVFFATPYVANVIEEKTPIDEMIREYAVIAMAGEVTGEGAEESGLTEEGVRKVLNAAGVSEEELEEHGITITDIVNGEIDDGELAQYGISSRLLVGLRNGSTEMITEEVEDVELPRDLQIKAIEMADLPDIFRELLNENNNDVIYGELGAETFAQYVAAYLSKLIINIVAFLVTFIFATILIRAVVFALNIVSELPGVGFVNRLVGGVLGAAGALIIVWVLFVILTLLYTTSIGKDIYEVVQNNEITKFIYEYNPIMMLATKLK